MMIATTVTLVIAAAVAGFIAVSARQNLNQGDRVTATDDARNALLEMTRELRDAAAVSLLNQRVVQADARQPDGSYAQVTYRCQHDGATSRCSRTDAQTGKEELLVEGVVNSDNFAVVPGSTLPGTSSSGGAVEVKLEVDLADAENPVALSSAVKPRNCSNLAGVINPC